MSALGLAIMIVAGAVTLDVVLENTRNTDASVVGQTVSNVDLGGFFTAGVLVGIALMIGLMLLLAGLRRANRKRLERKELERSYAGTATHVETLQEERDRLLAELEEERRGRRHSVEPGAAAPMAAGHPQDAATRDGMTRDGMARDSRTHEVSQDAAPIYPTEAAPGGATQGASSIPAGPTTAGPTTAGPATAGPDTATSTTAPTGTAAGTATQEHDARTKPSLKQRLLGS